MCPVSQVCLTTFDLNILQPEGSTNLLQSTMDFFLLFPINLEADKVLVKEQSPEMQLVEAQQHNFLCSGKRDGLFSVQLSQIRQTLI